MPYLDHLGGKQIDFLEDRVVTGQLEGVAIPVGQSLAHDAVLSHKHIHISGLQPIGAFQLGTDYVVQMLDAFFHAVAVDLDADMLRLPQVVEGQ